MHYCYYHPVCIHQLDSISWHITAALFKEKYIKFTQTCGKSNILISYQFGDTFMKNNKISGSTCASNEIGILGFKMCITSLKSHLRNTDQFIKNHSFYQTI